MKKIISIAGITQNQRLEELERTKIKYEKKGYVFIEYADDGITNSKATFEVDEVIIKKERAKNSKIFLVIAAIVVMGILFSGNKSLTISSKDLSKPYPFNIEPVILKCFKDGDIKSPIVVIENKNYGLTSFADNKYGQSDLNALNKYWKINPDVKGLNVDISEVTNIALSLCE